MAGARNTDDSGTAKRLGKILLTQYKYVYAETNLVGRARTKVDPTPSGVNDPRKHMTLNMKGETARADFLVSNDGHTWHVIEAKKTTKAPYTTQQKIHYENIDKYNGVVAKFGKPLADEPRQKGRKVKDTRTFYLADVIALENGWITWEELAKRRRGLRPPSDAPRSAPVKARKTEKNEIGGRKARPQKPRKSKRKTKRGRPGEKAGPANRATPTILASPTSPAAPPSSTGQTKSKSRGVDKTGTEHGKPSNRSFTGAPQPRSQRVQYNPREKAFVKPQAARPVYRPPTVRARVAVGAAAGTQLMVKLGALGVALNETRKAQKAYDEKFLEAQALRDDGYAVSLRLILEVPTADTHGSFVAVSQEAPIYFHAWAMDYSRDTSTLTGQYVKDHGRKKGFKPAGSKSSRIEARREKLGQPRRGYTFDMPFGPVIYQSTQFERSPFSGNLVGIYRPYRFLDVPSHIRPQLMSRELVFAGAQLTHDLFILAYGAEMAKQISLLGIYNVKLYDNRSDYSRQSTSASKVRTMIGLLKRPPHSRSPVLLDRLHPNVPKPKLTQLNIEISFFNFPFKNENLRSIFQYFPADSDSKPAELIEKFSDRPGILLWKQIPDAWDRLIKTDEIARKRIALDA